MTYVGKVIKVPLNISPTGFIKIVGDQTHCKPNTLQLGVAAWELLGVSWDVKEEKFRGEAKPYKEEEIQTLINTQPTETRPNLRSEKTDPFGQSIR